MDKFNQWVKLCLDINYIYKELYKLEQEGMIENGAFLYLVSILKGKVIEEDNLFKDLVDNEDYDKIREYVLEKDIPSILRMKDYIAHYEINNIELDEDEIHEYDDEEYIGLSMKTGKICSSISRNIYMVYASFLNEYIVNCKDNDIRNKMLAIKYYNSFVNHDMEKALLNSNFNVPRENYVDYYLKTDLLQIDVDVSEELIIDIFFGVIDSAIDQILSVKNIDYNNCNIFCTVANYECVFKACMALLSEFEYESLEDDIFYIIGKKSSGTNTQGVKIIKDSMDERKKYKTRVKKISMRSFEKRL